MREASIQPAARSAQREPNSAHSVRVTVGARRRRVLRYWEGGVKPRMRLVFRTRLSPKSGPTEQLQLHADLIKERQHTETKYHTGEEEQEEVGGRGGAGGGAGVGGWGAGGGEEQKEEGGGLPLRGVVGSIQIL